MKLSVQLLSQKHKREPIDDLQDAQYVFGFVMVFVVQWFCTWAFHVWKINTWKLFVEKIRGMVTDLFSLPMLANAASGTSAPRIKLSTWATQRVTSHRLFDRNEKADYWPFNPTNHLPFFRRKQSWITNPFLEASFLGLVHRTWFRFWWALFLWFSGWGNIKNNQGLYPPKLDIESSTLVHHPLDWKIIFHPTAPFLGWKRCPFGVVCLKKPVWCKASKELASSTKRQCFHIPNLCRIFPNSMKPF